MTNENEDESVLIEKQTNELLEMFWSTQAFGCKYRDVIPMSMHDRYCKDRLEKETYIVDGRYKVPMLFRPDFDSIPENRDQAYRRYVSMRHKLLKNADLRKKYCDFVNNLIKSGYARKLSVDEINKLSRKTRYISHFYVMHPTKGKLRVVLDAAEKCDGVSLNDCLCTGLDLLNSLIGCLLRFREGEVAMSADVEQMFLRVLTSMEDSEALRFFWSEVLAAEPEVYMMESHIFGASCSPCCASYALRRCALDNQDQFSPEAVLRFLRDFYVDDLMSSCSKSNAVAIAKELVGLAEKGGFKLTKWVSTSKDVLEAVSAEGVTTEINLDLDEVPIQRVLGIMWDVTQDVFTFKARIPEIKDTMRGMLSEICTQYDPIGALGPYTFRAKCLMQQCWLKKMSWDDTLPAEIMELWQKWVSELKLLDRFKLARKYWPEDIIPQFIELHFMNDASERGFSSVCYIRVVSTDMRIPCSFVMASTRVASLGNKSLTLPKLELQGCVLSTRLAQTVKSELSIKIDRSLFWSDSRTVLQYINNDEKRFKPFVANRVAEIRDQTVPSQWRYCNGELMPADDATRCNLSMQQLTEPGHRWLNGPKFLWQTEDHWPKTLALSGVSDDDPEVRRTVAEVTVEKVKTVPKLLNPNDFSSPVKFFRLTALCMRFVKNCRLKDEQKVNRVHGYIMSSEMMHARLYWVKVAQNEAFRAEIASLSTKTPSCPRKSSILSLMPKLDNGFLRVGGRLDRALVSFDARHQYILPKNHKITDFLIFSNFARWSWRYYG